ncbi:hypothetical protein BDF21DRAFT_465435 [Thamnidium elegans]|uniref:Uncharacterized protein n=1 Tax=Thamnidium elegans TaxID=101142 RepID=A0A8H7T094_9FUNG|nr:hypothetical protein INT48_005511 [Thamnidium elegans]KAI8072049.1 hypothetical protein BDF21DRAFT_465435 [Thamnidium elegans]
MSTKSSNPFQSNDWNYFDKLGESSYMPHFYESDMTEPTTPSFRSLSPKIYNQQHDYFTERTDELDDSDDLYEATLMNSNFLQSPKPAIATPVNRLLQILNHINPTYPPSPLSDALVSSTPSVRSQFSSSSQPQPVIAMVAMPDPRNKGKPNM